MAKKRKTSSDFPFPVGSLSLSVRLSLSFFLVSRCVGCMRLLLASRQNGKTKGKENKNKAHTHTHTHTKGACVRETGGW